jgi:hypothetical protein
MEKNRSSIIENRPEFGNNSDVQYNLAYKRVKRIKGFYIHALVFVVINIAIVFSNFDRSSGGLDALLRWDTYSTALFWGIGLAAHGLSVFGRNIFFGSDWEEKKIQELMKKDQSEKWE